MHIRLKTGRELERKTDGWRRVSAEVQLPPVGPQPLRVTGQAAPGGRKCGNGGKGEAKPSSSPGTTTNELYGFPGPQSPLLWSETHSTSCCQDWRYHLEEAPPLLPRLPPAPAHPKRMGQLVQPPGRWAQAGRDRAARRVYLRAEKEKGRQGLPIPRGHSSPNFVSTCHHCIRPPAWIRCYTRSMRTLRETAEHLIRTG